MKNEKKHQKIFNIDVENIPYPSWKGKTGGKRLHVPPPCEETSLKEVFCCVSLIQICRFSELMAGLRGSVKTRDVLGWLIAVLHPSWVRLTTGKCYWVGLGGPELDVAPRCGGWAWHKCSYCLGTSKDWIPCSGAGNSSWLLGCGGVTRNAVTRGVTGQPWHGALPCSEEQAAFCKPGGLASSKGRNQDSSHTFCFKEQEHPTFKEQGRLQLLPCLAGWFWLMTQGRPQL